MQNSPEKKQENKAEKKEEAKQLRCPFGDLVCSECRLFQFFSKDIGKICSINFLAMRSE